MAEEPRKTVFARLVQALAPESTLTPNEQKQFDLLRTDANLRRAKLVVPLVCALHFVSVFLFKFMKSTQQSNEYFAWRSNVVAVHLGYFFLSSFFLLSMYSKSKSAPLQTARQNIGEITGLLYCVLGAILSSNVQRVHTNINTYIVALIAVASMYYLNAKTIGFIIVLSFGLLVAGLEILQTLASARLAGIATALGVSIVAFGLSRAQYNAYIQQFVSQRTIEKQKRKLEQSLAELEKAKSSLEERVQAQVEEILSREVELERLNARLREKVQERAKELAVALSHLASSNQRKNILPAGTVLGARVEIIRPIGHGGMGVVYLGKDLTTQTHVAVKVFQASSSQQLDALNRFFREAAASSRVNHPAVVQSLHVDVSEDGKLFQMLELVEGETLEHRLHKVGKIPSGIASRVGSILAQALAVAHEAKVVHRDVKPGNIMLTTHSPGVKLLDFGISKLYDVVNSVEDNTQQGRLLGTPAFMAPEQINNSGQISAKTDVYALGLVIYEMVAGRSPFDETTPAKILLAQTYTPAPSLLHFVPDADPELANVVSQCLQKDLTLRPNALELSEWLGKIADRVGVGMIEAVERGQILETTLDGQSLLSVMPGKSNPNSAA